MTLILYSSVIEMIARRARRCQQAAEPPPLATPPATPTPTLGLWVLAYQNVGLVQ